MKKKLSIITINYNNLDGLKRTVESVINQTWQEFEYIVIDGGSTDGSAEYIESQRDKIDYWVSEPDKGIYNAMNKGIYKAKGEYVVFLNSGDFFLSSAILQDCYAIIRNGNADVFYGQIKIDHHHKEKTIVYPDLLTLSYMKDMVINHQACFFKLTTLLEHNGYDEKYSLAADYHYYLKLYIKGKIFCPILFPTVKYDISGVSSLRMEEYRAEMKQVWTDTIPTFLIKLEKDYFNLVSTIESSLILKLAFKLRKYKIKWFHGK
ncbi:glycosyltransferase family 2 protein [Flavobacterium sp. DGU38]|uniref:Glycosyltransferase family 2 protein n=1 Tax=Flavobacterium calami TaxID=3139144 RepID=A0ABU9IJN8_9FLAO